MRCGCFRIPLSVRHIEDLLAERGAAMDVAEGKPSDDVHVVIERISRGLAKVERGTGFRLQHKRQSSAMSYFDCYLTPVVTRGYPRRFRSTQRLCPWKSNRASCILNSISRSIWALSNAVLDALN